MLIACETAIDDGKPISRQSRRDKEFPFQNWFKARLEERKIDFDEPSDGVERQMTSILPAAWPVSDSLIPVGELVRTETDRLMTGYYFDLTTNKLQATYTENPSAGQQHHFIAYRSSRHSDQPLVRLRQEEDR